MSMAQYAYHEYMTINLAYLNRKVEEFVTGHKVNLTRAVAVDLMMTFRFGPGWTNQIA